MIRYTEQNFISLVDLANYLHEKGIITFNEKFSEQEFIDEMEAYITSLIKELVAEAKPELKEVEKQIPGDMDSFLHNQEAIWSEQYVTEFEQNLLKALDEK